MQDQNSPKQQAISVAAAMDHCSQPVTIPEPKILPYSRLCLRAHSATSISSSPSQRILTSGSPSQDYTLGPQQQYAGQGLQPLNPTPQTAALHSRPLTASESPAQQQQNRRPPLPPSPQASKGAGSSSSFNARTASAWINPLDGSPSGSGGRHPRLLSAAATAGSYGEPGLLSALAAGSSMGLARQPSYTYLQQQQQQLQQQQDYYGGQHGGYTGMGSASLSPAGEGILAAAVMHEDVATAAGNPYHPQHDSAMQLLADHQALQMQQLQQRDQHSGISSGGRAGYVRSGSFSNVGMSPHSDRASPRASPRAYSRSSSYNRLSELGTSPGLIEASFMGMVARCSSQHNPSTTPSRSASLTQMMQQQQAAIRAQQEGQQRVLQHSRSAASFGEWTGSQQGSGSGSLPGSRPESAASRGRGSSAASGAAGAGAYSYTPGATPQPAALDWEDAQQDLQQQHGVVGGGMPSIPQVGEGRGMRALPGRPGLHWLSRADERESAARGLLGLPRPGLRQVQPLPLPLQHQQPHLHAQGQSVGAQDSSQGSGSGSGAADSSELSLSTPAAAAEQPTSQRMQYDPGVLAAYASAVGAAPTSLRTNSTNSTGSPMAAAAAAQRALFGGRASFGRQGSASLNDRAAAGGSPRDLLSRSMSRSGSYLGLQLPTCLICLDQLTPSDFETGEALYLACRCKGEVALRHRQCAEKWSRIKGNTICDVCKAPILNLPEVPPLPAPPQPPALDDRLLFQGAGLWGPLGDEPPAVADHVFDCIRVTWVVLIVCILFFETTVTHAFVTGALVGSAYVALSASLASCKRWRRQRREDGEWQQGLHTPFLPV